MLSASSRLAGAFALALIGSVATAEVVFTGTVTPGNPAEVTDQTVVMIGPMSSNDMGLDPRGAVIVDAGSQWVAGSAVVGASELALARMRVTGPTTRATLGAIGALSVGNRGSGHLTVEDGAWLEVGSTAQNTGTLTLGPMGSLSDRGQANVDVDGVGTLLTVGRQLRLNGSLTAKMRITNGAVVRVGPAQSDLSDAVSLNGEIHVEGAGTELQTNGLTIGDGGFFPVKSLLRVADGAVVRRYGRNAGGSATLGSGGVLELDGGTFALSLDQTRGVIRGSGVLGPVGLEATGSIEVGKDDRLVIDSSLNCAGRVEVIGGELEVLGDFALSDVGEDAGSFVMQHGKASFRGAANIGGSMEVIDSTVSFAGYSSGGQFAQFGSFRAERSRVDLASSAHVNGKIELVDSNLLLVRGAQLWLPRGSTDPPLLVLDNSTIASDSQHPKPAFISGGLIDVRGGKNYIKMSVNDNGSGSLRIADNGSLDVGGSIRFPGGVVIGAGGSLASIYEGSSIGSEIALTVDPSNLNHSSIDNADVLHVSGRLLISAVELPDLAVGQSYSLITALPIVGGFSEIVLPDLPGTLEFLPQLTETELSLLVIDTAVTLPGDCNSDGLVDAADYTLIRDNVSSDAQQLELMVWRTNYGRTLALGAQPIPEPTTAAIGLVALALAASGFRRAA